LQAVGVFRDVDPAFLKSLEIALRDVDPAVLPADEALLAVIDNAPLDTGVGFVVVDQTPAKETLNKAKFSNFHLCR
jgi:hypothetical protein